MAAAVVWLKFCNSTVSEHKAKYWLVSEMKYNMRTVIAMKLKAAAATIYLQQKRKFKLHCPCRLWVT